MSKIMIIDDDKHVCNTLAKRFERLDHSVDCSFTLEEGLNNIFANEFDVLFLDVNLPDGNGLDAIEAINDHPIPPEIIIMTGDSDLEGAALAIKLKAWDYIQKTGSYKEFKLSLLRAIQYRHQKQSNAYEQTIKRELIIGKSHKIKASIKYVSKASNNDVPVLITGETGTGKELFSKAIHENSHRKENDFVVVDCAALPEHLVESVLFGHSKGSFTGADTDRVGLIRLADGGTLFLDEVGELPIEIQKKFLRALQEKRFRPVGSKVEISSDFRVVAATHRDIPKMVKEKQFREDFYFRIASIKIEIPPLRRRKSDIPLLTEYHLDRKSKFYNESPHEVSDEFMADLMRYDWPGNVRELFNTIDYACSDAFQESILFPNHLPDQIRVFNIQKKIEKTYQLKNQPDFVEKRMSPVETLGLKEFIEKMKYKYIADLISYTKGDIKTACQLSSLSRGHLYSLLKKFKINEN
ncbi:MAG: sigma-54-dependent Fis family transcriptional regulator [Desulfobacteraceae bacterium]|nr:sigma-54-dependent Fis family transcriptional regulator [Desulfobacteraceae bacterium]